jgi:DNA-binding SARP family transcriptional activator
MGSPARFRVLGPLVAEDARGLLVLKGPRHRAVLARLLVARGRVVPVARLVDDLWDDPPEGAVGAIQTFVSALRRALEPDRPPRAPAELLVTMAPGYALRTAPDTVDAMRFETAVVGCGELLAQRRAGAALSQVDEALALWRGPAYAEFADQAWARGEISSLDELRLVAREWRAEALLALGRAAEAVPALETQVAGHPWREDGWRLLALALYRAGRQGDALGTLRRARQVLAEDLGVDPGPALRELEADILGHEPRLYGTAEPAATRVRARQLIGRAEETTQLADVAAATVNQGWLGLVVVSGDAGAGKTALAESFAAQLATQGWTTAWGGNPEHEGAPSAWPWHQILAALADGHDKLDEPPSGPDSDSDPMAARFHWYRAVGARLTAVARRAPLLLVLDDLHWAGEETLALLASVVAEPVAQPVLVVATYRTTDLSPELADFLGRVARAEPTRIYLGGLARAEVPELVRETIGREVDAATADVIYQRSGGNPFFVRELARLFDADGADGLESVPPGVRDVVRFRVAKLPEPDRTILQQAAVLGSEVDLEVLTAVSGEPTALDVVESATQRGFLVERGPRLFRFAHALVRDTVYHDISHSRRARWHATVGEAIERLRPDDVDALAHHFLLAEDPATAGRAARYTRAAAEQAERRFAPSEAARLWEAAMTAQERSGDNDVRVRLDLVMGMVRALAVAGALARARHHRAEAIALAESLDDPALTARVIGAFDVPALWTDNDDLDLAHHIAEVTERTLAALPPGDTAVRSRLLATLAVELRNTGGDRARAAAHEAEAIARGLDDPALLAFALNARFMQSFDRTGLAPRRAGIGRELVKIGARHELVTFEVLGHLVLVQAHSALAEFTIADEHAAAADRLGEDYRSPLVSVFTQWYQALRTAVSGKPREAEAAYRAAAARLAGTGMSGMDNGILALSLLCQGVQRGGPLETDGDFGGYEPWCRPFTLLAAGRRDRARAAAAEIPTSPHDLLYEARACLHAVLAIEFDDHPTMERLHAELLPASAELAGAGSGLLTLGPVAQYLGDLAAALGRPSQAADHYRQALAVATRADAPQWIADAQCAPGAVDKPYIRFRHQPQLDDDLRSLRN